MDKLVSMKIEKDAAEKLYGEPTVGMPEMQYPYGLKICLDEASLSKLGIQELPEVGQKMTIEALVEVVSVSKYDTKQSGVDRKVDLQITDMELGEGTDAQEDAAEAAKAPLTAGAFYGAPEQRG